MATTVSVQASTPSSFLTRILVAVGALLFAPLLLLQAWTSFVPSVGPTWVLPIGWWSFLVSALVLGHPTGYWLLCIGMLVLIVSTLVFTRHRGQQITLGVLLVATLAFMTAPYPTAITTANGDSMFVPTEPTFFSRGLKTAQAMGEIRSCEYQIIGWQQQTLFYQSECAGDSQQTWQYTPGQKAEPVSSPELTRQLHVNRIARETILDNLFATGVYPPEAEPSVRRLHVPEAGYLSVDGQWLALKAQYVYGPEDIIVVQQK